MGTPGPKRMKPRIAGATARSAKNPVGGKFIEPTQIGHRIVSKPRADIVMDRFIAPNARLMENAIKKAGVRPGDVKDVFQISALKIHQQARNFDQSKNPAPWVATIARNAATDFLRQGNTRWKHESAHSNSEKFQNRKMNGPEAILAELEEQSRRKKEFSNAMNALPDGEREIMQAYLELERAGNKSIYNGLSNIFGMPLGTIKGKIKSAFAKMRASLEGKI